AVQNAVIPDTWKQSLATGEEEHPVASRVGSLATLPLAGFNPSVSGTRAAIGGLARKAAGLPMTIAERQAVLNATVGGALGGVQEGVMQQVEGRPFNLGEIALNTGIGATFTSPNAIGRKYGFKPLLTDTTPEQF